LINGWIAGVPSILGREIAFREQRRSAVDYIEVATLAQARDAVDWLAGSPKLRRSMSANGAVRAEEFTTERLVSQWRHLLFYVAQKAAERWFSGSAAGHKRFFLRRQIQRKVRNIGHRALRAVGQEQYAI
jgi:hypothetical protein